MSFVSRVPSIYIHFLKIFILFLSLLVWFKTIIVVLALLPVDYVILDQSVSKLSVKDQVTNILDFQGRMVPVAATTLCSCEMKAARYNM